MKLDKYSLVLIGTILGMAVGSLTAPGAAKGMEGMPLSVLLRSLEEKAYGIPVEAEFDDGYWKVTVCKPDACRRAHVDPRTAEEMRWRRAHHHYGLPPEGALPLSAVVQIVESRGLGMIEEVEFDNGAWKFDLRREGRKHRLYIDPGTGETRR